MKCEYGCDKEALYQFKNLKWCCSDTPNKCEGKRKRDAINKIGKSSGRKNKIGIPAWNKGLTKDTSDSIKRGTITFKNNFSEGKIKSSFLDKKHTEQSKQNISDSMKGNRNANHRGDRQSYYKGIRMDSSWEVKSALYFDNNEIIWKYNERGFILSDKRSYFPDFLYTIKKEILLN